MPEKVKVRIYEVRVFGLKRIMVHGDKVHFMDWREDEWVSMLPDDEYEAPPLGPVSDNMTKGDSP